MPPLFVLVKGAVLVRFFKSKCLFDTGFCFSLPLLNDGFAFGRGCVGFPGVLLSAAEGVAACFEGVSSSRSIASAPSLAASPELAVSFGECLVSSSASVDILVACGVVRAFESAGLVCFLGLVRCALD